MQLRIGREIECCLGKEGLQAGPRSLKDSLQWTRMPQV